MINFRNVLYREITDGKELIENDSRISAHE